jgi:oxygen-independent coproporphyrinogen-3 oxidase
MAFGCYVHVPFCSSAKCLYCAFCSIPYDSDFAEKYIYALLDEARRECLEPISTLYFGGGTPTSLSSKQLNKTFSGMLSILNILPDCEITFEASPETLDAEKLDILRDLGAKRLSIGVQSFSNKLLQTLGRRHDSKTAVSAIETALLCGFEVSIDLIYGVPGQSLLDWEETLERAVDSSAEHVSLYCLSIEENTPFERMLNDGFLPPADEDLELEMFEHAGLVLSSAGFRRYELSNFAKGNKISRHNLNYWRGGGYYGLGASAHSYFPGPPRWTRCANTSDLQKYTLQIREGRSPREFEEVLTPEQRVEEFIMLRLRLAEGFSREDVMDFLPEIDADDLFERLGKPISEGFLEFRNGRVSIPENRLFISNECVVRVICALQAKK